MSPESDSDVMVIATSAQDPNKFPSTSKDNNTTTSQSAAESSSELKSVEVSFSTHHILSLMGRLIFCFEPARAN
jgi:hypothetical protein